MPNPFRSLPSVSQLLENERLKKLVDTVNHSVVANGVRDFLADLRTQVAQAAEEVPIPSPNEIAESIANWLEKEQIPPLRPVINATGILLHTGLGRAPLAEQAISAIKEVAAGYASLELELESGERGQRIRAVEKLLRELTGAEAACVSNNNAAATMITLSALAAGKEVIVSRGELIEIGGSYRLPDVMQCSRATLREVGTTNKTRIADYADAINENTAALLKVHPSNYLIMGFSESATIAEVAKLGRQHGLPVIDDVGSGALVDFSCFGLHGEPVVRESIAAGADLVLFSGDKLLGGPQCGIIVGRKKYVQKIINNPLMRAMRVDKLTLAGLQATLKLYRNIEQAKLHVPLLRMLSTPLDGLKFRAEKIVGQIRHLTYIQRVVCEQTESMLGGGSLPTQHIPSWSVVISPQGLPVADLAAKLRTATPSLIGRVNNDQFFLDLRTVFAGQDMEIVQLLQNLQV
jgi:L-seryl-tRNA(Ser) seleniumtransferase